jgi:hypothetical protein
LDSIHLIWIYREKHEKLSTININKKNWLVIHNWYVLAAKIKHHFYTTPLPPPSSCYLRQFIHYFASHVAVSPPSSYTSPCLRKPWYVYVKIILFILLYSLWPKKGIHIGSEKCLSNLNWPINEHKYDKFDYKHVIIKHHLGLHIVTHKFIEFSKILLSDPNSRLF